MMTHDYDFQLGEKMVNGVELPDYVIAELRQLGLALSWYTPAELQDAVQACKYDHHLIDDPEGLTFEDRLALNALGHHKKRKSAIIHYFDDAEDEDKPGFSFIPAKSPEAHLYA